jgi:DNA polymerase-4
MAELHGLIETVSRHCSRRDLAGKTVTLKLRYADFRTVTRSRTVSRPVSDAETSRDIVALLLNGLMPLPQGVRLLGITLSGFSDSRPDAQAPQSGLFGAEL